MKRSKSLHETIVDLHNALCFMGREIAKLPGFKQLLQLDSWIRKQPSIEERRSMEENTKPMVLEAEVIAHEINDKVKTIDFCCAGILEKVKGMRPGRNIMQKTQVSTFFGIKRHKAVRKEESIIIDEYPYIKGCKRVRLTPSDLPASLTDLIINKDGCLEIGGVTYVTWNTIYERGYPYPVDRRLNEIKYRAEWIFTLCQVCEFIRTGDNPIIKD